MRRKLRVCREEMCHMLATVCALSRLALAAIRDIRASAVCMAAYLKYRQATNAATLVTQTSH